MAEQQSESPKNREEAAMFKRTRSRPPRPMVIFPAPTTMYIRTSRVSLTKYPAQTITDDHDLVKR
jgi:hypothetical protein